jgi:hypothetical protein
METSMAKRKYIVDLTKPIPEWGLSEAISTAVPRAASGIEIKSTRDISSGMHTTIRAKIDKDILRKAHARVVDAKKGTAKTVFRAGNRIPRTSVFLTRKGKIKQEF